MRITKLDTGKIKIEIDKIRKKQYQHSNDIDKIVEKIVRDIRLGGDKALFSLTKKFDNFVINKNNIKVDSELIKNSLYNVSTKVKSAIRKSVKRVKDYQAKKLPKSYKYKDEYGNVLGWNVRPLKRIGIYVPGGTASYPSSLIMTGTLAKVAGCKEIVVVTPPSKEGINPAILYTAMHLGINEIFQIGGAQAIAALAYGTKSINKVDKIVGPGNIFVATGKKKVFGAVDIDMIAGPSEVLIISNTNSNPKYVAADLIAQAEHDVDATAICLTTSYKHAERILDEIRIQSSLLPRREIIRKSIKRNGKMFILKNLDECVEFSNYFAPEHLEIFVKNPSKIEKKIINAGSIFLGENSAEAFGDYIAGPSHVLPTSGSATFSSPLSVLDFLKYSSYSKISRRGVEALGSDVIALASEEGLDGHADSIKVRLKKEIEVVK
mgnify:FL=1